MAEIYRNSLHIEGKNIISTTLMQISFSWLSWNSCTKPFILEPLLGGDEELMSRTFVIPAVKQ